MKKFISKVTSPSQSLLKMVTPILKGDSGSGSDKRKKVTRWRVDFTEVYSCKSFQINPQIYIFIYSPDQACVGDVLVLTKPLGTQVPVPVYTRTCTVWANL